ncbi:DNA-3-methyladenine glycosylase I [Amphritea sp. 2_MG-2023]|uniref:DNA-3-methyladenine glycosylase I n=1 Tax=Amphritea TaxID=515417 RepID=UPI001C07D9F8|nr:MULTISPECIES: DNA-3-methyladenine glycosylase I [Amphritea]MBU2966210.1 DNA-3-methyladenine glycosylase I [Amphritea atlantica]MDO6417054.1 DNA-3-methyladenine glycosylase I [Amphritea sp. 2_MG-2023]
MCHRCAWATSTELEQQYHDEVWGVPQSNDQQLFEFLVLESAQAGLSWRTILQKREGYNRQYEGFDPAKVAAFSTEKIDQMLLDPGIVRNRRKVESSIKGAQVFVELAAKHGSFANYIWQFVDGKPIQNRWQNPSEVPAETEQSRAMSKALKQAGMTFVGPTICYAYMQATGMVNDHEVGCLRYQPCRDQAASFSL